MDIAVLLPNDCIPVRKSPLPAHGSFERVVREPFGWQEKCIERGFCCNGVIQGEFTRLYYRTETKEKVVNVVRDEIQVVNGEAHGTYRHYDTKGTLVFERQFKHNCDATLDLKAAAELCENMCIDLRS